MRAEFLLVIALSVTSFASDAMTQRLDRSVEFLEARLKSDPGDFIAANRLCDALLRRSRWTGRLEDWRRASEVASQSADSVDVNPGGAVVQAQIAMAGHRFTEARELALKLETLMPGKPLPFQLLGDALLELGDLDGAAKAYTTMTEIAGSMVGTESRAARLAWMRGQIDESQRHLTESLSLARKPDAQEDLAWALVQNGELAFRRGDFATAEKHYTEALKVAPEYWTALEHLAELRGAQGKDEEAVSLFTKAAGLTERPEIWQSLGDFHFFQRRADEARRAHEKALAGYRASIDRGETLYVHHLAGFYSDSQVDAAEAVKWAQRDLKERQSAYAWDALAWALMKAGDSAGALDAAKKAIATGLADPHVLQHAGMIYLSAGEVMEGQRLLKRCAEINPHFTGFHVHR